jgi:hypothetical protein
VRLVLSCLFSFSFSFSVVVTLWTWLTTYIFGLSISLGQPRRPVCLFPAGFEDVDLRFLGIQKSTSSFNIFCFSASSVSSCAVKIERFKRQVHALTFFGYIYKVKNYSSMPELLDLLYPWPVVSTLALYLGLGDLIQLSRVSTGCRAALHGFPRPRPDDGAGDWIRVRAEIFIGMHQSSYWRNLKSTAQMSCAEANHRRGYRAELCRYCSIPVCDACVVRVCSSLEYPTPGILTN